MHLELAELTHHVPTALVVQTVDVEHPSQVVGLVLEDPRQEPLGPDVERAAVEVGTAEPDPQGADGRVVRTGDREAPLLERVLVLEIGRASCRERVLRLV